MRHFKKLPINLINLCDKIMFQQQKLLTEMLICAQHCKNFYQMKVVEILRTWNSNKLVISSMYADSF